MCHKTKFDVPKILCFLPIQETALSSSVIGLILRVTDYYKNYFPCQVTCSTYENRCGFFMCRGVALSKFMEQSRHGEANSFSDSHEIPLPQTFFFWGGGGWKRRYMILFKRACHLCLTRDINLTHARPHVCFKPNIAVILQLKPGYSNCSHFFRVSLQDQLRISLLPLMLHTPLSSQPNSSDDPNNIS